MRDRIGRCAFADCAHVSEPGCALRDGVDSDESDEGEESEGYGDGDDEEEGSAGSGKASPSSSSSPSSSRVWQRHPWYVETLFELREAASSAKARQAEKAARQGAVRMKSSKRGGDGGGAGASSSSSSFAPGMRAEALLNPKKDRRVSRRSRKKGLADLLEEEGL